MWFRLLSMMGMVHLVNMMGVAQIVEYDGRGLPQQAHCHTTGGWSTHVLGCLLTIQRLWLLRLLLKV